MARSCAICGKVSMGGFNPQSSGMNRVRAHRRMKPNLQPLVIDQKGQPTKTRLIFGATDAINVRMKSSIFASAASRSFP